MQITTELAKPISDRLMSFLPYNINIMNEKGIIVSSGDDSRIGKRHDGAIQVLLTEKERVINPEDATQLAGTKPGVNLPISFENTIVGVVGITGDPNEIYRYAKLVKMTVEILLEQMDIRSQIHYRQNALRNWIQELITNETFNQNRLKALADSLHIDLSQKRAILLIQLCSQSDPQSDYPIWNEFMIQLVRNQLSDDVLCGELHSDVLFLAMPYQKEQLLASAKRFKTIFHDHKISVRIGIGKKQSGLQGYRSSCLQAMQSLRLQKQLETDHPMYVDDWGLIRIIEAIPLPLRNEFLSSYLPKFAQVSEEGWQTLESFLLSGLSMKETSRKLHIHRNTLLYRLKRLHETLGLNPRDFEDAVFLQVLLLCRKCTAEQ